MAEQSPKPMRSKQKRSDITREKIIAAGIELFSSQGYHATSSKKIARAAGVAIGSFYNYFTDKKQLLLEIHRRHGEQIHRMFAETFKKLPPDLGAADSRAMVRWMIQQAFLMHDLSPDLQREITALSYTDPDFAKTMQTEEAVATAEMIAFLQNMRNKLWVEDLEAAAWVMAITVEAVTHSLRIFGAPVADQRITDALGDMMYRFLFRS